MGRVTLRANCRVRARGGFSLLELSVAMVLLILAIGGLSGVLVAASKLNQTNRETALALSASRQAIEVLQAEAFGQVFARYNTDPADDPGAPGSGPGKDFAVPGLTPWNGDPDGFVGEYLFPVAAGMGGAVELREDVVDPALGMPRDLDGDGVIGNANCAAEYLLLPVRVRLRWRGVTGERELTVETFLGSR